MLHFFAALLLAACISPAHAQGAGDFPNKPIRFVLISSAGSGGDSVARLLAEKMSPLINGKFVIDNRPGASGALAADTVAKAPPDGYTILLGGNTTHVLLPAVNPKLPYDPIKEFMPLGRVGVGPILLIAAPDFPASNLQELVALARSKPGMQYASWGNASTGHFCGELLAQQKQLRLDHIPYKSVSQIITDMMGGHIKLGFVDMSTGAPLVKAGRVKGLGACTSRTPALPEVGSYEDAGINFNGMQVQPPMWAVYAPAGTPKAIVDKLGAALKTVVEMPEVKARLFDLGVTGPFMPGEEFREALKVTVEGWKEVARKGNITMD